MSPRLLVYFEAERGSDLGNLVSQSMLIIWTYDVFIPAIPS